MNEVTIKQFVDEYCRLCNKFKLMISTDIGGSPIVDECQHVNLGFNVVDNECYLEFKND